MSSLPCADRMGRAITYLRVSVTDRCNLRCVYCMPAEGLPLQEHADILRYEEIARLVSIAAELGIRRVRLTGGEPLARRGLTDLVRMLAGIPGVQDLSMTTNGSLLARYAAPLAEAGLTRVNISLDTLRPDRFRQITRCGELAETLAGIEAARHAGLEPVKVNMVVMRGLNDDEVVEMARRSLEQGWNVRFIEVMPLGEGAHWSGDGYVPIDEVRQAIEQALGSLEPAELAGNGPARYYRWAHAPDAGTIGFISPISDHFCAYCNRLRLTADGKLLPCLFGKQELDLRAALRQGADDAALRDLFREAIAAKPRGHDAPDHVAPGERLMSRTGG